MRVLTDKATDKAKVNGSVAEYLYVMLPGANHVPEGFVEHGFVQAARERQLPIDFAMVKLTFSHIADMSAIDTLRQQVILPAQQAGYCHIWLAGISIGGYIGMAYDTRYPGDLDGLLLLAPYPGNRITTNEIVAAGGLQVWQPTDLADEDVERTNWLWLKRQAQKQSGQRRPELYLGYGLEDRFADSHAMMAACVSPANISTVAGDHVWPVWQTLWSDFLDKRYARNDKAA